MARLTYFPNGIKVDKFYGTITSITSNYTIDNEHIIFVDASAGAITVTLEEAVNVLGKIVHIKKIDSSVNTVTIQRAGSDTIDGQNTQSTGTQYVSFTLVAGASGAWYII